MLSFDNTRLSRCESNHHGLEAFEVDESVSALQGFCGSKVSKERLGIGEETRY